MNSPFTGTGVAVVTPFAPDGTLDVAALRAIIRHLIAGKVEYLVALGTTGESVTLDHAEQEQILDIFFDECTGKIPVVMGIGGNDTRALCAKAAAWTQRYPNAAGILSASPYYNKPTQEGIFLHYQAFAACTSLPILLYNVPPRTSSNVLPETVVRIARACPNVVGVKEASGSIVQGMELMAIRPEGFLVLSGDDVLATASVAMGFDGLISVIANALPLQTSDMIRAALAGDIATARSLHYQLQPFMQQCFAEGNPAGVKAALEAMGLSTRMVRLPLAPASDKLAGQLAHTLQSFTA